MKKSEEFEVIAAMIQTSLKNLPDTKVLINHKIVDKDGNPREFDIIIEAMVSSIPICIAIECKCYETRNVSAEKIEAFYGKCISFPSINKKIFIVRKGYQKTAKNRAKDFGIDLYTLSEIKKDKIMGWLHNVIPRPIEVKRELKSITVILSKTLEKIDVSWDTIVFFEGNEIPIGVLLNWMISEGPSLPCAVTHPSSEKTPNVLMEHKFDVSDFYILFKEEEHELKSISSEVVISFEEKISHVSYNELMLRRAI